MLYAVSFAILVSSCASSHDVVQAGQLERPCNATIEANCNNISAAECRNNVCVCKPGYKMDTDKSACRKTSLGKSCHNDAECKVNNRAWCNTSNICDCIPGFVQSRMIKNRCLQEADIGDYCEEHHQCYHNNSMCTSDRACKCKPTHRYEGGSCISNPEYNLLLVAQRITGCNWKDDIDMLSRFLSKTDEVPPLLALKIVPMLAIKQVT